MKTTLPFLIMLIFQTFSLAQPLFGIKAGLNVSKLTFKNTSYRRLSTDFMPTFMVGAQAEFKVEGHFGVNIGLQLQGKGARKAYYDPFSARPNDNLYYVQMPVHLSFKTGGFFASAGPYLGAGLFGTSKIKGSKPEDISFGNSEFNDYSRLDFGLGTEIGYTFGSLRASAGFDWGLANTIPDGLQETDFAIRNLVVTFAVTYLFGGEL